jgi:hypothetical protein
VDSDSLRTRRETLRRTTEIWLLELMLARGADVILRPHEHLRLLEARALIEELSDELVRAAVS